MSVTKSDLGLEFGGLGMLRIVSFDILETTKKIPFDVENLNCKEEILIDFNATECFIDLGKLNLVIISLP
jgi:hypothetical protein